MATPDGDLVLAWSGVNRLGDGGLNMNEKPGLKNKTRPTSRKNKTRLTSGNS